MLFARAEALNLTVAKLLTGKDLPLSSMEMQLEQTYLMVKHKLQKQDG